MIGTTFVHLCNCMHKRKRSTSPFTPHKKSMMEVDATQGAAGSGIPVSIMSGDAQWARKKNMKFKKRVPLKKEMSLGRNIVEYIWKAATPFHAKYGAIPIPCGVDKADTFGLAGDGVAGALPMHLYDLTCAPNFTLYQGGDPASTTYQDPLKIQNPNVFMECRLNSGVQGTSTVNGQGVQTSSYGDWVPTSAVVNPGNMQYVIGTDTKRYNGVVSQMPSGLLGENKWYVKYMKKPIHNKVFPGTYDEVPIGAKAQDNANLAPTMITPPVGRRPIHISTDVKMCLVGCVNEPVTYDISLIRFKDDICVPNPSWNNDQQRSVWSAGTTNSFDQNAVVQLYQNLAMPFTHGPTSTADRRVVDKYVQVLGKKTVTIQPKTTIDGDQTTLNHTYVSFKFRWNECRSFGWRKDQIHMSPAVPYFVPTGGSTHGMGFVTDIAQEGNITTHVSPRSRIFLCVRARSEFQFDLANLNDSGILATATGSGNGNLGAGKADKVPSYDITITNKWIPDLT